MRYAVQIGQSVCMANVGQSTRPGVRHCAGVRSLSLFWAVMVAFLLCAPAACAGSFEEIIDGLLARALQSPDPESAEDLLGEADQLHEKRPKRTSEITANFYRAAIDETRGRIWTSLWRQQPERTALRHDAQSLLAKTFKAYESVRKQAQEQANHLEYETDPSESHESEIVQLRGYAARSLYGQAWASQSLGLLAEHEAERDQQLNQAIKLFGKFTRRGYRENPIIAECFLGQARCCFEKGDYHAVIQLLDRRFVTPENTPWQTFRQMCYLRMNAWKELGSHLGVTRTCADYFHQRGKRQDGNFAHV